MRKFIAVFLFVPVAALTSGCGGLSSAEKFDLEQKLSDQHHKYQKLSEDQRIASEDHSQDNNANLAVAVENGRRNKAFLDEREHCKEQIISLRQRLGLEGIDETVLGEDKLTFPNTTEEKLREWQRPPKSTDKQK